MSSYNIGNIYTNLGKYEDALPYYEEAAAGWRRVLGPAHIRTLRGLNNLVICYRALDRRDNALRGMDEFLAHARENAHPDWIIAVCDDRLRQFGAAADPAGGRGVAGVWEGFGFDRPEDLYSAAYFRALTAGAYTAKGQPAEARADAERAMAWLTKAVAAGFRDREHIEADADLAALRGRPDFRQLVGSLPHTAPPPRPAPSR